MTKLTKYMDFELNLSRCARKYCVNNYPRYVRHGIQVIHDALNHEGFDGCNVLHQMADILWGIYRNGEIDRVHLSKIRNTLVEKNGLSVLVAKCITGTIMGEYCYEIDEIANMDEYSAQCAYRIDYHDEV